jgi:hypothetical protein
MQAAACARENDSATNPAVAHVQDAKALGETVCSQFQSVIRKMIGHRRTYCAVIPAKAGIHAQKDAVIAYVYMGPGCRGDDDAARFKADFRPPVGFDCRIWVYWPRSGILETVKRGGCVRSLIALKVYSAPRWRKGSGKGLEPVPYRMSSWARR